MYNDAYNKTSMLYPNFHVAISENVTLLEFTMYTYFLHTVTLAN